MLLPHSGVPPHTTNTHRRCRQNCRLLSCRQSPWLRQLGTFRHLGDKLSSSSSYSVNTRSRRNNATRTNQHLKDAEWSPLASDKFPGWLQSGDINTQSPRVWWTRLLVLENQHRLLSLNASLIGRHSEAFCDSIKDQDWRTSFWTLSTANFEQSATEHSQRFIRTIVSQH